MAQREVELLQEAAAREKSLLDTLEETMRAVPAVLQAMQDEFAELHVFAQVRSCPPCRALPSCCRNAYRSAWASAAVIR